MRHFLVTFTRCAGKTVPYFDTGVIQIAASVRPMVVPLLPSSSQHHAPVAPSKEAEVFPARLTVQA